MFVIFAYKSVSLFVQVRACRRVCVYMCIAMTHESWQLWIHIDQFGNINVQAYCGIILNNDNNKRQKLKKKKTWGWATYSL